MAQFKELAVSEVQHAVFSDDIATPDRMYANRFRVPLAYMSLSAVHERAG